MSALTSSHNIEVWFANSNKQMREQPENLSETYVHLGLSELHNLYIKKQPTLNPLNKRHDIYKSFEHGAKLGSSMGLFFSGLALKEGYGCKKDVSLGNEMVRVAANFHKCRSAAQYLMFMQGCHKLFKEGNYFSAIPLLKQSGLIAKPVLDKIKAHIKEQLRNFGQNQKQTSRPRLVVAQ